MSPKTAALRAIRQHPTFLGPYRLATELKQAIGPEPVVRDFGPGAIIQSRDGVTSYRVADDGSFRRR